MLIDTKNTKQIINLLIEKKIGVLPTDTIYGIHCLASDRELISKVNEIKGREVNMPYITLISDVSELDKFNLIIDENAKEAMLKYWPGPNTLIFRNHVGEAKSFRLPDNDFLEEILKETGPLISTSANLHGQPSSKNVQQAISYFGDKINFYVDGGELNNPPSSIYKLEESGIVKIR